MTSIANVACCANVAYQATVAFCGEGNRHSRTARADRTLNVWGAASQAAWRWYQRARNRRALNQLSDRMLADLGFDQANLVTQIDARLDSLLEARRQEAQVYRELMAYNDAELDDIGVRRVDIPAIARGDHPFEVEASNPVTTVIRPAPPANDRYHSAAA